MSTFIPLTTKKNGTNTPKATAVSFESNAGQLVPSAAPGAVIMPAAKPPSSRSSPSSNASSASANTSTTIHRTASWRARLHRALHQRQRPLRRAHGEHARPPTASAMKATRITALWSGALGREDQRQQQDRPELAHRARRQQVGAEAGAQLARCPTAIGISVPSAVVAIAEPVYSSDSTIPAAASTPPSA